jgi:CheY-like chemotaxis protein
MARILVLDDEPTISMMLQDWLTELNCETVGPAYSVEGALTLIETACPDAAILDLSVRDETSYAVATSLRARRVPFAFATGHGGQGVVDAFKHEIILSKPFDFADIKDVLVKLLGHGSQTS